MYWIDNNTGIATPPSTPAVVSPSKRYFTNGGAGVQPSTPEDFWFHMVQEELLGVLTLAGVTPDKSDLNQVAKAIQSIAFSAYPVGAPIPWPTAVPPSGFLAMIGQSFSSTTYPKLALAYPALVLPDLRARFVRGLDSGRGVDTGRVVLSDQANQTKAIPMAEGAKDPTNPSLMSSSQGALGTRVFPIGRDVRGSETSNALGTSGTETRPDNIAFLYIVRAI